MEIKLTLALPRDALSVPVVRRVLNRSMDTIGVVEECRSDIEIALTEAVTNVLDHAVDGDRYEVSATIDNERAIIEVVDTGAGFDAEQLGHLDAEPSAEEGRGIQLIRALVDKVRFVNRPERGTIVHFEKELQYVDDAPVVQLSKSAAYPHDVVDESRPDREVLEQMPEVGAELERHATDT